MARSEEKKDFWGNAYTEHRDDTGNPIGVSREKTNVWGESYTEHADTDGSVINKLRSPRDSFAAEASGQHTGISSTFDAGPGGKLIPVVVGVIVLGSAALLFSYLRRTGSGVFTGKDLQAPAQSPATTAETRPLSSTHAPKSSATKLESPHLPTTAAVTTNNVLSSVFSPQRDFYIEERRNFEIWLVNAHDRSRQSLLYTHHRSAQVVVSPDERLLALNDFPGSNGGGAKLFKRKSDSALDQLNYVPVNHADGELDDMAWQYYLRVTGRKPNSDRDHVCIPCIGWEQNSGSLILRIVGTGSNSDHSVPMPWLCRYDTSSSNITAISPLSDFTIVKNPSVGYDPSSYPIGERDLLKFVWQHVEHENSHDTGFTLGSYADTVDYWDKKALRKEEVLKDKNEYFHQWQRTREDFTSQVSIHENIKEEMWTVTYSTRFRTESDERNEFAEGSQTSTLEVKKFSGELKITADHGKILLREKGHLHSVNSTSIAANSGTNPSPPSKPRRAAPQAEGWTDITGAFVYGTFVRMTNGEVFIRREGDNMEFHLPFSRLNPASQQLALRSH